MDDPKQFSEIARNSGPLSEGQFHADDVEPWQLEVLVLDDDRRDRDWIGDLLCNLTEFSAKVTFAKTIAEARHCIATGAFDLGLIDYELPDGRGDAVVKELGRALPGCATILISSHIMAEVSLFGMRAGANGAISKDDLNPELLETTIRFALAHQRRRK